MRFDEMKKNIPETPDFIHQMIQDEVNKQLEEQQVIPMVSKKQRRWSTARIAAVCVLGISTAAYAGAQLYRMSAERHGAYGLSTAITTEETQNAGDSATMTLPETIPGIDMTANYLPEGMDWTDEEHERIAYTDDPYTGGFSIRTTLFDSGDLNAVMEDTDVIDSEMRTFGSYQGVYLAYNNLGNDTSFSQRIYLLCPDLHRAIVFYIGNNVTKEEAICVVENLEFTENDAVIRTADMEKWSDVVSPQVDVIESSEENTTFTADEVNIYSVKETFPILSSAEDTEGEWLNVLMDVSVDSVQIADDLTLLQSEYIPEEWTEAIDSDGKLLPNTISYVEVGDGMNSIDEVVSSETVAQKLVYVTATYTNHTDETVHNILYFSQMMLLEESHGQYTILDPHQISADGHAQVIWDGVADPGEMQYMDVVDDSEDQGSNYIASLAPGESIQISMGWIVNETDLDQIYLDMNSSSDGYLEYGLVDIRP